jgi:hypothetical protein
MPSEQTAASSHQSNLIPTPRYSPPPPSPPPQTKTGGEGYNKVPVAFGIFKLVISMVVFDDEVRFGLRHGTYYTGEIRCTRVCSCFNVMGGLDPRSIDRSIV